ncbi:hypothetical protein IJ732_04670 [bacterium]|nr:hypothetical protein [bacterium]
MKIFARNNKIKIRKEDLNDAKASSASFNNLDVQKRAFLNVLGARVAINGLFNEKIDANNIYSLYTVNTIREKVDIADIYYKNLKIDVRVIFNEDEIFIPKQHRLLNIEPDLYLVIKIEKFETAQVLGYFYPSQIDETQCNGDYYFIDKNVLERPKKTKTFLDEVVPAKRDNHDILNRENVEELFVKLTDRQISDAEFKTLIYSVGNEPSLRERLSDFENFEFIAYNTSENEIWQKDGVLNIIGAQDNYNPQTLEEETFEEAMADDATKTSKEIIDDLFNDSEFESTENSQDYGEEQPQVHDELETIEEVAQAETEQTEQTEQTEETEETIVDEQSEQAEQSDEVAQAETEQTEPS